jgi:hypothetical protein
MVGSAGARGDGENAYVIVTSRFPHAASDRSVRGRAPRRRDVAERKSRRTSLFPPPKILVSAGPIKIEKGVDYSIGMRESHCGKPFEGDTSRRQEKENRTPSRGPRAQHSPPCGPTAHHWPAQWQQASRTVSFGWAANQNHDDFRKLDHRLPCSGQSRGLGDRRSSSTSTGGLRRSVVCAERGDQCHSRGQHSSRRTMTIATSNKPRLPSHRHPTFAIGGLWKSK